MTNDKVSVLYETVSKPHIHSASCIFFLIIWHNGCLVNKMIRMKMESREVFSCIPHGTILLFPLIAAAYMHYKYLINHNASSFHSVCMVHCPRRFAVDG